MTVRQGGAIKVDVEATTDQYVRAMGAAAKATDKHAKAVEKDTKAIARAKLEYQVHQARVENLTKKYAPFDAAARKRAEVLKREAQAANTLGSSWGGVASKMAKVGGVAGAAVFAIGALASKTSELANESLQLQNLYKNIPFSLNRARSATRGLADDETLARNAIMAHQSGVATTSEAYAKLVGNAQTLALKMGRDVNETIERVTQGLAKQEREILDELVILPRMEDMWKRAAAAAGKTTEQLTDQEKNAVFLKEAQAALSDATKGVEVDMDGAAGAIARLTVEAKNARTEIMGGVERTRSLEEGMRALDGETLKLAANYSQYGANVSDVRQALRDAGVDTSKLTGSQAELEKRMRSIIETEAARIGNRAEDNKLSKEQIERAEMLIATGAVELKFLPKLIEMNKVRLGLTKEQVAAQEEQSAEDLAVLELKREAMLETENEIEYLRAKGGEEAEINMLVLEQLELKADILTAEGKLEEAAKARRNAELAAARAEGAALKKRGGGRGRRGPSAAEKRRDAYLAKLSFEQQRFDRVNAIENVRAQTRGQQARDADPFSDENMERQLANVISFEDRKAQVILDRRMRAIEEQRAAGVEPMALIDAEASAQLEHLNAIRDVEEARLDREIMLADAQGRLTDARALRAEREISAVEYQGQVEDVEHQQAMARLAERKSREEEVMKRRIALVKLGADTTLNAAASVARATILEGQSLKKSVAGVAKSLAFEHSLKAASEVVNAAIAAASYRYGAAGQHTANAAASVAVAATAGGIAAAAGGSGAGPSAGGFDAASFGPGGGTGGTSTRSAELGGPVPISQESQRRVSGEAASSRSGSPVVVQQTINVTTLGEPDEETIMKLEQAQRKAGSRMGSLRTG